MGNRVNTLEGELRSELAGERARHDHTAGRDETSRLTERLVADIAVEVVAEVSAIGQIESLEDQLQFGALAELDVFAEARIQLEEGLAAQAVEADLLTRPRGQAGAQVSRALADIGQQIVRIGRVDNGVRLTAPRGPGGNVTALNSVIGTRRGQLHDRRELNAPRQINDSASDPAMAFIIGRRAEIALGKNVIEVSRTVAERRRVAIVSNRAREHVVGVEAEMITQAAA